MQVPPLRQGDDAHGLTVVVVEVVDVEVVVVVVMGTEQVAPANELVHTHA